MDGFPLLNTMQKLSLEGTGKLMGEVQRCSWATFCYWSGIACSSPSYQSKQGGQIILSLLWQWLLLISVGATAEKDEKDLAWMAEILLFRYFGANIFLKGYCCLWIWNLDKIKKVISGKTSTSDSPWQFLWFYNLIFLYFVNVFVSCCIMIDPHKQQGKLAIWLTGQEEQWKGLLTKGRYITVLLHFHNRVTVETSGVTLSWVG